MCGANQAILQANDGKQVTVVLRGGGNSSVFQGVLRKNTEGEYWEVMSPRGLVPQGGTQLPIPETLVIFGADRLGHLIVPQETTEQALEKIKKDAADGKSGILGPSGSLLS